MVYDSFKEDAQGHCCLVSCEYKDFLDHLAASDPYQLYDESMLEKKIVRLGWPGCYHYELTSQNDTVSAVNFMSLEDLELYQIWCDHDQAVSAVDRYERSGLASPRNACNSWNHHSFLQVDFKLKVTEVT